MKPHALGRRRGTAMMEFVLVLPFLIFILALVVYFGRGVVRVQRAHVTDRYEAWREAAEAPGPGAYNNSRNTQLGDAFHTARDGTVPTLEQRHDSGYPAYARNELVNRARQVSTNAGNLAEDAFNRFPGGSGAAVRITYTETVPVWKQMDGPIDASHVRPGNDWRFANGWHYFHFDSATGKRSPVGQENGTVIWEPCEGCHLPDPGTNHHDEHWVPNGTSTWILPAVRDAFLMEMDQELEAIEQQENPLAGFIRSLYLDRPGYLGPWEGFP